MTLKTRHYLFPQKDSKFKKTCKTCKQEFDSRSAEFCSKECAIKYLES